MRPSLVIHGSTMGGYGLPGLLAFVTVFGGLAGIFDHVWLRRSALIGWLALYCLAVGTVFVIEAINRLNVLEVSDDRIHWSFRQPPQKGEQPLSDLQRVEVNPSGARLVFEGGDIFASKDLFRRGDIRRLVERLQQLGAQMSESPSIH